MALSELPPWLNVQPWANPSDVLSQASAAAARRAATELAQRELAQRGQQFQETLNQRNMELAQRQALAQLEQAGVERQMAIREGQLGLEQQKQSAEAEEAAIRFQGMQGLQADLAAGVPYTEAYLRHLPKIAFGSPQTIASAGGREEANAINARRYAMPKDTRGTSQKVVDDILETEKNAKIARESGDTSTADELDKRAMLLKSGMKGLELETYTDDTGKTQIRVGTKGLSKSDKPDAPTVAVRTDTQKKLIKYENASELMTRLTHTLRPQDVGIQGTLGELLVDKTMEQFIPGVANKERVANRAVVVAIREGLMRDISDDSRFSNLDREEISKALPSSGLFESHTSAIQKINTVREILRNRVSVYSERTGITPPLWSLTPTQITDLIKLKKLSKEDAAILLRKHHDFD